MFVEQWEVLLDFEMVAKPHCFSRMAIRAIPILNQEKLCKKESDPIDFFIVVLSLLVFSGVQRTFPCHLPQSEAHLCSIYKLFAAP